MLARFRPVASLPKPAAIALRLGQPRHPCVSIRNPHVVHNLPLAARRDVGHTDDSRRCGRVAEGGGLLNRYRVVKPYRGFESLRLRHTSVASISRGEQPGFCRR